MRVIYYGECDPAWLEPDSDEDRKFIEETRDWPWQQVFAEMANRGISPRTHGDN